KPRPWRRSSRRSRPRASPSVAPPVPTTGSRRPPWRTASVMAISDTGGSRVASALDTATLAANSLLRVATAGSGDDGKSTLIGRLLHDTKSILADELEAVDRASIRRGHGDVNLALLTDGLRAEREQGITIDAAYRYFATPRRSFVLIDTPGHVQY